MYNIKSFLTALVVSALPFTSGAATLNPNNGHYYELIEFNDSFRLDWNQAKAYAEASAFKGSQGYLATLTSAAEDDFVWNLGAQDYFLGAYDTSNQDSSGNWKHNAWQWVTGETFAFTNWLPGEPNHWQDGSNATPNNEDYLMYWGAIRGWNDTNLDSSWLDGSTIKYSTKGFVVEYSPSAAAVPVPAAVWLFGSALFFWAGTRKNRLQSPT